MSVTGHTPSAASDAGNDARVSIRDVAREAGVSYQTVSRVINDHPYVSQEARAQVLRAIKELRYQPSRAARALARGSSDTVTVLTSNTHLYGYSQTLAGIEQAARVAGAQVAIRVLDASRGRTLDMAIEQVTDPGAGAVIVLAFDRIGAAALQALPERVRRAAAAESSLGRKAGPDSTEPWAWYDDVASARKATEHLLDLGHTAVHHLAIPSSGRTSDRTRGWLDAHRARGLNPPAPVKPRGWGIREAHEAALSLLVDRSVTAVLCGNDEQAIGVMRAAHEMGIRVPEQLSVVGFDDAPAVAFLTPALTTVRFDFVELGRRTFDLLDDANTDGRRRALPEPELIVRESTAPPGVR
jgi:DNA-binding LacI/PurR family transcriptional regulator